MYMQGAWLLAKVVMATTLVHTRTHKYNTLLCQICALDEALHLHTMVGSETSEHGYKHTHSITMVTHLLKFGPLDILPWRLLIQWVYHRHYRLVHHRLACFFFILNKTLVCDIVLSNLALQSCSIHWDNTTHRWHRPHTHKQQPP